MCTERATPEQRQRILKLARDGRAFHDDPVAFRLIDIEFHQALNVYAGNGYLAALAQGLYDVALDVRRMASAVPGVIKISRRPALRGRRRDHRARRRRGGRGLPHAPRARARHHHPDHGRDQPSFVS